MIELLHRNPSAFTDGWKQVSRFYKLADYDFKRFRYRVYGIEYDKNDAEFKNAHKSCCMWRKLQKPL